MATPKKKGKYIGVIGAMLVHVLLLVVLVLVSFTPPQPLEEDGMPVMLGEMQDALGADNPSLVEVDVTPQSETPEALETEEQELITQQEEESIAIKPKAAPQKENIVKAEKTEAEKKEEARLAAEAKAQQELKDAEEAAKRRVAGAFDKVAQMGNKGNTNGKGAQGAETGNAATGAPNSDGGYGTFNLGGRSLGEGGLPRPAYNVQDEGKVVVAITVNPAGQVIATNIDKQTNTVNAALRKAAEEAAKKARFNSVNGLNNQTGTITYYFNLK